MPGPSGDRGARGQSLVEFSLVVLPLLLLLLAIVQFGFIFNAYVTMSNATREAARTGTIYIYDRTASKDANDLARNEAVRAELLQAMNLLGKSSPQFSTTSTWTQSGSAFTNGDLLVEYELPAGATDADNRAGQRVTVRATYHQDLLIPLIANLLPRDAGGRLALTAEVTMVVN
jgi:Flp pilus assembly protein TadG